MLYTNDAIKNRKKRSSKLKRRIIAIIYIILIPILIYNISLIVQAVINPEKTPSFFGIKTYVIISGSMEPELQIGDIVIVKEVLKEELKEKDIISFRQGQSIVTHRISKKIKNDIGEVLYKTKGDKNNTEDSGSISYDLVEGKVIKVIPKVGKIVLLLQGKLTIIIIIIIFYIYILHSERVRKKKKERREKRLQYEESKRNY